MRRLMRDHGAGIPTSREHEGKQKPGLQEAWKVQASKNQRRKGMVKRPQKDKRGDHERSLQIEQQGGHLCLCWNQLQQRRTY